MSFPDILQAGGGVFIAVLGMALAVFLPGIGCARGVGLVGEAASGLLIAEPEKFGKSLVMQLMPASQGLYGFVIFIMTAGQLRADMSILHGLYLLMGCLPIAIVGWPSAMAQARIAVQGINVLSRNESQMTKSIIYCVMVETYALLAFVASLIMINTVAF